MDVRVCVFTWLAKEKNEEGEEEEEGEGWKAKAYSLPDYLPTHNDSSKIILMRYVFSGLVVKSSYHRRALYSSY